jgi:hypothetical protein
LGVAVAARVLPSAIHHVVPEFQEDIEVASDHRRRAFTADRAAHGILENINWHPADVARKDSKWLVALAQDPPAAVVRDRYPVHAPSFSAGRGTLEPCPALQREAGNRVTCVTYLNGRYGHTTMGRTLCQSVCNIIHWVHEATP